MQALSVLCLCGIVVTCKEPHKVDVFCFVWLFFRAGKVSMRANCESTVCTKNAKGGDMMGRIDDVLTDDLKKTRQWNTIL